MIHDGSERKSGSVMIALLAAAVLPACMDETVAPVRVTDDDTWTGGEATTLTATTAMDPREGILGNSLPGTWRPFLSTSPWNTPVPPNAPKHPDSDAIMATIQSKTSKLAFARSYTIPVWVVDAGALAPVIVRSDRIFDWWDMDRDGWSDVGVPMTRTMWAEGTNDAHICIVDPALGVSWEMSRFSWLDGMPPACTTFNLWTMAGIGHGNPNEGDRWGTRGGRGSGFPLIAGLLRPEEIEVGEIRHALVFTFSAVRCADDGSAMFVWPPACRADGDFVGSQYPIEGMRFQLDPAATDSDFDAWGLTPEARVVARALQTYGMFLGDKGGDMKLQVQLLSPDANRNRAMWDARLPGFYRSIEKIPTNRIRVLYTGEPTIKS